MFEAVEGSLITEQREQLIPNHVGKRGAPDTVVSEGAANGREALARLALSGDLARPPRPRQGAHTLMTAVADVSPRRDAFSEVRR